MAISPTPADFAPLLFAGEWEAALDAAVTLGYEAIEVSVRDPDDPVVISCNEAMREHGLQLSAIATGQSFYSDGWALTTGERGVRTRLDERMLRIVDMAAPWKALVVIGGVRGTLTGSESDQADQYRRAVESVQYYAQHAQPFDVSLAVEPINRYETNLLNTIEQGLQFIDDVGLDNVGLLADTFHMNIEEADLAASLRSAGDRLLHVQFTDSNRLAAGWGHIDFPELASVLHEIGYDGYLSTETLPVPDSRAAARQAIEFFTSL
ncbi:MAG: sugar phosphate isomerase/epimerase family protein [Acidimicrobiia bacterium]|nr:sugar phosphate isomerase/epimerase family protein [Acidimicrobiia bacterium]